MLPEHVDRYELRWGMTSGLEKALPGVRRSLEFRVEYVALTPGADNEGDLLYMDGVHGEVHDPDRAVRALIGDSTEQPGITLGDGVVFLCTRKEDHFYRECAWADSTTAVRVSLNRLLPIDRDVRLIRTFYEAVRGKA